VSEVLPLTEGCRWLENNAARVLATRPIGRSGRPFWLGGVSSEVRRQPFGVVLVIGPGNYPLFLPAIHALHALVAGNGVLLKPAPGTRHLALAFAEHTREAGLDSSLLTILPESVEAAREAIAAGVDKVVFTGSSENGREVLAELAARNFPSVMELSGEDAVLVLADADLDLVVRAIRFGQRLNGGATCIAPQRIIVVDSVADALLAKLGSVDIPVFRAADHASAVAHVNASESGLGVSIFSRDVPTARALAGRIKTGFAMINDLIVPTADPRLPFGGVKASGFGSTRGEEGLLEMTYPHVITVRGGKRHPHFDDPSDMDAALFAAYIRAAHGRSRIAAIWELLRAISDKIKSEKH